MHANRALCWPRAKCGFPLSDGASQPHPHTQRVGAVWDNEPCVCAPGDTALRGLGGWCCRHPWSPRPFKYKVWRGSSSWGTSLLFVEIHSPYSKGHPCWPLKETGRKRTGVGEAALQPWRPDPVWKPLCSLSLRAPQGSPYCIPASQAPRGAAQQPLVLGTHWS